MVFHNPHEARLGRMSEAVVKVDARVKRTKQRLREAIVALVLERGYEDVTIRDIAERAEVGYATYFRHYPTKDALLLDILEGLLTDLMALLEPTLADEDASHNGATVFEHVRQHHDLYRVLIASQRSLELVSRAEEVAFASLGRSLEPSPDALLPPAAAVNHLVRSLIALIEWWLDAGMPLPPERMGAAVEALIMRPVRAAAFRRTSAGVPS